MNSERCSQCKHFIIANAGEGKIYGCDRSKCVFEPTSKNDLVVDAVSRKAVHDMLENLPITVEDKWFNWLQKACMRLAALPSVTPKQRIGKWIKSRDCYGNNHYTCPFCEHDIATKYAGTWKDNYCSNCGARMESEE